MSPHASVWFDRCLEAIDCRGQLLFILLSAGGVRRTGAGGTGGLAPFLRRPDRDRRDVILPLELDCSRVSTGRDRITQLLDWCIRLVHLQIHPAQVHACVVDVTALAGLPVHDEFPVVGIVDQHV